MVLGWTKTAFKWTKEETTPVSRSPCEKKPLQTATTEHGSSKNSPDRKFPILECILKSCRHSYAFIVILLTEIASLLSLLSVCPSMPENSMLGFICRKEQRCASVLLIAWRLLGQSAPLGGDS